jgi:cobyrinic acid a,c-diamide synthase
MNYKKPVLDKLKKEHKLEITTRYLGLMMAKYKTLVDYEYTNVELLIDFANDILLEEFANMIRIYQSTKKIVSEF